MQLGPNARDQITTITLVPVAWEQSGGLSDHERKRRLLHVIFRLSCATCLVTHFPPASRFADATETRQRNESRSSYWFLPRTFEYPPDQSDNLAAKSENARALAVADHLMCVSTPSSSARKAASPGGYAVRIHHSNESALLRDARYRAFATAA